jgi:pSer/pThr/pTyr-binding forkhead associated (FHA) protein
MKCMAKRPADRFTSAGALADELRRFRADKTTRKLPSVPSLLPLVVLTVDASGKKIRLHKPITLVGRAPECGLLLRAADVSKHHCQILIEADRVLVEDLGSANGTHVNGQRIQKAILQDGDELRVADHAFRVRIVAGEV